MKILVIEDDREAARYLEKAFTGPDIPPISPVTARPAIRWPRMEATMSS